MLWGDRRARGRLDDVAVTMRHWALGLGRMGRFSATCALMIGSAAAGLLWQTSAPALADGYCGSGTSTVSGASVTCTYSFSGGEQTFAIPAGVNQLTITAIGGTGGSGNVPGNASAPGGRGARLTTTIPAPSGASTLYVEVGGNGADGGFNGGGEASFGAFGPPVNGGGGASDVQTMTTYGIGSLGTRLVVAGGGGGGGGASAGDPGGGGGDATNGSSFNGLAGAPGGTRVTTLIGAGGLGATSTAGGVGGVGGAGMSSQSPFPPGGSPGANGGFGSGGAAGQQFSTGPNPFVFPFNVGGGGGGGGYYGGGGGGAGDYDFSFVNGAGFTDAGGGGGGGGGSSYVESDAINTSILADTTGAPEVMITFTPPNTGPTSTTTTLTSSANPSTVGQSVTYTAIVAPVPTSGTVAFTDGGSRMACGAGSQPLSNATATCVVTYTSVGQHAIAANYGDSVAPPNFTSSSANLTQTINPASTTTALSISNATSNMLSTGQVIYTSSAGQQPAVAYTATLSPIPDGGSVAFSDGGVIISGCSGVAINTTTGAAACAVSYSSIGQHSITASYSGDANYLASGGGALMLVVNSNLTGFPKLANGAYNLSNTNLASASLIAAPLSGASLANSRFVSANLSYANAVGADLSNSNFTGGNFTGANLSGANMSNSNFTGGNFTGANLSGANLSLATVKGAMWSNTTCPDGTNSDANAGTCVGHP